MSLIGKSWNCGKVGELQTTAADDIIDVRARLRA
jgi:hypothetical protein